ncbi:MAG: hypothetical protein ABIB43_00680 [archaeon]
MNKRGAYFFVLDALIGSAIFLISVVMIINSSINTPTTGPSYLLSEDIMTLLLNTPVIEFRDPYLSQIAKQGQITNLQQSLFHQIAEFHYTGKSGYATNLTRSIIESVLPEQFGMNYSIIVDGVPTTIYSRLVNSIPEATFQLSSRKITFLTINQTEYFGPDITELRIWN